MNLGPYESCTVDDYGTLSDNISLNVFPVIISNFEHLFSSASDLSFIQLLLCYRSETLTLLFLLLYLTQWSLISICTHFTHLYVRRRRGSYLLKKTGIYTVESFIFNSFAHRSPHLDRSLDFDTQEESFFLQPSVFLFTKKSVTLLLLTLQALEFFFSIPQTFSPTNCVPLASCFLRALSSGLILLHLFRETQPTERIAFTGDPLSPPLISRASQLLISLYWCIILLDTTLSIQLFTVNFTLPDPGNLTASVPLSISTFDVCSWCHWRPQSTSTLSLPSRDLSLPSKLNISRLLTQLSFSWAYLSIYLAQLLLAFCPDYDVKAYSKSDSSSLESIYSSESSLSAKAKKPKHAINPEDRATALSKLTFLWFSSTIYHGFKCPLSLTDIFPSSCANRVDSLSARFFAYLRQQPSQWKRLNCFFNLSKFRLILLLLRQFGLEFVQIALIKVIPTLLTFLSPILLDRLIEFVKNDEPYWHGYVYVSTLFFVPLVESLLNSLSDYRMNILALKIRSTLTAAIYESMLHATSWSGTSVHYTSGQLVNMMSIDTQRVLEYIKIVNLFWICPLQFTIAIAMLWSHLGYGSLAGLAVLLLMLPFNGFIGTRLRSLQAKLLEFKDNRVKVLSETVSSIRAIKLYAWEAVFQARIASWRQAEVAILRRQAVYSTAITFAFNSAPFLVAFASFTLYLMLDENNVLNAKKMFVSLAIFNIIRRPLAFFPQLITSSMLFMVSMKRIGEFLATIQVQPKEVELPSPEEASPLSVQGLLASKASPCIELSNCTFSWSSSASNGTPFQLSNLSLHLSSPQLIAVIGEIGSGKSSLLSALLGQMNRRVLNEKGEAKEGDFLVNGSIAYVPQEAWIQSGTIRENILFGRKYDQKWYQKVVEACALERDFQYLSDGDQMLVGQKGVSLSGGQKQRISMARALYANADLYLIDSPLSALDTAIAKHVFTRVIGPGGLLAGKIRLLVTHNMAILPRVDSILLLKGGTIVATGQYTTLMSEESEFTDFLAGCLSQGTNQTQMPSALETPESSADIVEPEDLQVLEEMASRLETQFHAFTRSGSVRRQFSCQSASEPQLLSFTCLASPTAQPSQEPPPFPDTTQGETGDLIGPPSGNQEMESLKEGSVSGHIYLTYLRRVGWPWCTVILLFFFSGNVFHLFSQLWLSTWSSEDSKSTSLWRPLYETIKSAHLTKTQFSLSLLGVYGGWGLCQTVCILLGTLLLNIGCLRASRLLHDEMLHSVVSTNLAFFDASSSSLGAILNRFTKDVDIADTTLIFNFLKLVIEAFRTVASFFPIIIGTDPTIGVIFTPITLVYVAIYKYCIATPRQLIRLESALRTPIYSFFTETHSGVSVIRAFRMEGRFIRRNYRNIDQNASAYQMSVAATRWMQIRLEFLGNLVVLSTAIFCVLKRGQIDSGMVGLCMMCAFTVTSTLQMLVRSFTDLESNIVSIERMVEFTELPVEGTGRETGRESQGKCAFLGTCVPLCTGDLCCKGVEEGKGVDESPAHQAERSSSWLTHGDITLEGYSARYRDNLDLCLRNITLTINQGSKVAIVGRTGAGKSSFALALFRLIEADSGSITISGVNIGQLGLSQLRSALTIIPQDTLLFSGTLRENMDPLGLYSDEAILVALIKVNLSDLLVRLAAGRHLSSALGQHLDEGRLQTHISAGQKQLLALARVLLRAPKVLILDEAYADTDPATEELLQATIHREFTNCTVLSIVHRLDSILAYPTDRVLVLDQGQVAEFDSPENLLAREGSLFSQMLHNRL